jgi:glutaminyl-peptide cyclotransferase
MKRLLIGLALLILAGGVGMFLLDFHGGAPINGQEKQRDEFAQDQVAGAGKAIPFDGERAMGYLRKVCELGPRMSGTPTMKKQQELIRKHFEDLGAKVRAQDFDGKQTSVKRPVAMTNLIVSFFPDRERRIIICSHYDTRPIADQEPDERKWREPFLSANDGGSGVAFLMEMGNHMKDFPTKVGVDFVFFDGEEFIWDRERDKYFLGSMHFAKSWHARGKNDRPNYLGAVLLDMIAGKGARFPVEGHSLEHDKSEPLCRELWGIADSLRMTAFRQERGDTVRDDHIQLQYVGIPAVDIIDFSYKHWHRLGDTPANCAPEGMEQVARVLTVWMQRVK